MNGASTFTSTCSEPQRGSEAPSALARAVLALATVFCPKWPQGDGRRTGPCSTMPPAHEHVRKHFRGARAVLTTPLRASGRHAAGAHDMLLRPRSAHKLSADSTTAGASRMPLERSRLVPSSRQFAIHSSEWVAQCPPGWMDIALRMPAAFHAACSARDDL